MARDRAPVGGYNPETHERVRVRRKGHWRMQRFGPDRSLTRKVRIKPYFVMEWRQKDRNYQLAFEMPEDDDTTG